MKEINELRERIIATRADLAEKKKEKETNYKNFTKLLFACFTCLLVFFMVVLLSI